MKTVIFWVSIATMFTDALFIVVGGVNLTFFDLVLVVSLALVTVYGWLWVPPKVLALLAYLIASGLLGIAVGTNSVFGFAKEIVAIVPNALYGPSFVRMMDFDVKRCFRAYAFGAFCVAAFGIPYFPFQRFGEGRLMSVMQEPSSFCVVCVPALYYYADRWHRERKYGWRFIVLLIAVVLTQSAQGYMGILFGLCLFGARFRRIRIILPVVSITVGCIIYSASNAFQLRLNDSVGGITAGELAQGTNASSFGVLVNFFITKQQFEQHPILGGGLGSHSVTYDKFYDAVPGVYGAFESLRGVGREEANSLLLRMTSELGLVGLALAAWFVWYCWPRGGDDEQKGIASALLCYLLLKALRSGAYFEPEQFIFLTLYAVNGMPQRVLARERAARPMLLRPSTA